MGSDGRGRGAGPRGRSWDSRRPCYPPPRCRSGRPSIRRRHTMTPTRSRPAKKRRPERVRAAAPKTAEIVREYGPFGGAEKIHGVSYDGRRVWAATGAKLIAFDPASGAPTRTLDLACE